MPTRTGISAATLRPRRDSGPVVVDGEVCLVGQAQGNQTPPCVEEFSTGLPLSTLSLNRLESEHWILIFFHHVLSPFKLNGFASPPMKIYCSSMQINPSIYLDELQQKLSAAWVFDVGLTLRCWGG